MMKKEGPLMKYAGRFYAYFSYWFIYARIRAFSVSYVSGVSA